MRMNYQFPEPTIKIRNKNFKLVTKTLEKYSG